MPTPSPNTHRSVRLPVSGNGVRHLPLSAFPDHGLVTDQLERIVSSRTFSGARRSQLFLRYILHHALAHPDEQLKEYSIAVDVFERDSSYDPAVNNTVRVEAGRLRSRLREYYAGEGRADPLLFEVPKGSYRIRIHPRQPLTAPAPAPLTRATAGSRPAPAPLLYLWAVPIAFLIGAALGYRAAH